MNVCSEPKTKIQRLAIAAAVAPVLRSTPLTTKQRRVVVVDRETGKPLRETTIAEIQESLYVAKGIEIDTQDGVAPKEVFCDLCGKPTKIDRAGTRRCKECAIPNCADCGKQLPRCYSAPSMRTRRRYGVPLCLACTKTRTSTRHKCSECQAPMTPRQVIYGRANAKKAGKEPGPPRCASCSRRRQPPLACAVCGSPLHASARYSNRAKRGERPICRGCYAGDVRAQIARETMTPAQRQGLEAGRRRGQKGSRKGDRQG